jgi:hypothetical protein
MTLSPFWDVGGYSNVNNVNNIIDNNEIYENNPVENPVPATPHSQIEHVQIAQQFIDLISQATLENTKLDESTRECLKNPIEESVDISDPDIHLSIDLFMACDNTSEHTYKAIRDSILRRCPDLDILTYGRIKNRVANISGVVSIEDDMCALNLAMHLQDPTWIF